MVAVLSRLSPGYLDWLILDQDRILEGQVWRLVTFIFIPRGSIWFIIFYLIIMWIINDGLEEAWGEFRLNLYLFGTWLGLVLAAWFLPPGLRGTESLVLYSAIFLAFASIYPNFEFLLFFILPLKVKWLAIVNAVLLSTLFFAGVPGMLLLILGMGPFLIVFLPKFVHHVSHSSQTAARRTRFQSAQAEPSDAFHTCSRCGVTDVDEPDLEFRIGDDDEEYCVNCLSEHD